MVSVGNAIVIHDIVGSSKHEIRSNKETCSFSAVITFLSEEKVSDAVVGELLEVPTLDFLN